MHFRGMLLRVDRSGSEEAASAGKQNSSTRLASGRHSFDEDALPAYFESK